MNHYVYQTTHDATGRFYRGVRSCKCEPEFDPYLGSGTVITNLVRKHGRDAFTKVVLSTHESREEALAAEAELVPLELIESDPLCLNRKAGGGEAFSYSKASRAKMARVKKGNTNAKGKRTVASRRRMSEAGKRRAPVTDAFRQRMSEVTSGENHPMHGKKHTAEARAKIRKARAAQDPSTLRRDTKGSKNPMYGRKQTPEARRRMREGRARARARREAAENR